MPSNVTGAVIEAGPSSLPLWVAIVLTSLASLAAMIYFWITVKGLERAMGAPSLREYTFATAFYPDALILKFGAEEKFRALSSRIKFTNVAWARMRWHLEKSLVDVIYANRRTAGNAIALNPNIIASERPLCIYRGFAICLKPSILDIAVGQELTVDQFATILKNGDGAMILVHADTDQHRALRQLLLKIVGQKNGPKGKKLEQKIDAHIHAISPDSDLLELMWAFDPVAGAGNPDPGSAGNIIGLAGGLTERVIAKHLGYGIVAPDSATVEDYCEINSFVYCSPPDQSDGDLSRMLDEVELLWEDAVTRILNQPQVQARFREFLNAQIRTQLGPETLARLGDQPVFSEADMVDFLSKWISFPRHGSPIIVGVAPPT
jgi:hypothetical protein